jgi:hypothetical protein
MAVNLFLERTFAEPLTSEEVLNAARGSAWCFDLHRVRWHGSFLRRDGHALICWFSAADAESARLALREADADLSRLWSGTVHMGPEPVSPNVVVERSFPASVRFEDIAALESAKAWCLEAHRVSYAQTFFSLDRRRMLCLYSAPDAEAVRAAQREALMPVDTVWACSPIVPA